MLSQEIETDLVNGLREIFEDSIRQIILYGSVARGENQADSDIDIAIVLEKSIDNNAKDRFIAWATELDLKYDRVFSIVDIEKEKLDKWGNVLPFYKNVLKEGVVLWKTA